MSVKSEQLGNIDLTHRELLVDKTSEEIDFEDTTVRPGQNSFANMDNSMKLDKSRTLKL